MNEIHEHMRSNGFHPGEMILDGRVHRFQADSRDSKESCWYCGFQNYTRKGGEQFFVVRYGSWRTGEVHQFQSDAEYTPEDRRAIKEQIAKAKKLAEDTRLKEQEKVAVESETRWSELQIAADLHPYLKAKGLSESFGARVGRDTFGLCLYVPMRDLDGKLWSLQKIQESGEKWFAPGGRVSGCFHVIGSLDDADTVYIAEGFATAASVHLAIERPVVVAFNAGNLCAVAETLKRKYPDRAFVICGDDDLWTKRPNGDPWNPGREKAEEVAKKILGTAVFPKFRLLEEGRTTDFNDLHLREGLAVVKEQIEGTRPKKHYVIALGYDCGNYYLLSNINPQIQCLTAAQLSSASGLCRLQPLEYWESLYPAKNDNGVAWQRAADHIMQECHKKGIFRPDRVRGRGVWLDESRVLYHMGDRLYFSNEEHALHRNQLRSRFIYEKDDALAPIHSRPLTAGDGSILLDAASLIRWKREDSFMLFAGWLALAPICGALSWRPHLWITGASGSGKSYLMTDVIHPILSGFVHFFQGQTTEAGIRQTTGSSTMPVIFDEFETNDERSAERVKSILELARQASSESDGIVAKGTVSGDAMQFKPRFSMLVSSVRMNLVHEEDRNRFCVLDLARPGEEENKVEHFERLKAIVQQLGPEYGQRLFARMFALVPAVLECARTFQAVLGERHSMRLGQQYGTLMASYWMLHNDEPVSRDKAKALCDSLAVYLTPDQADEQDEMDCLNHLLQRVVAAQTGSERIERGIMEMIRQNLADPQAYWDSLQRIGICRDSENLFVASKFQPLQNMYSRTQWSGSYAKSLSRVPGARANVAKRFTLHDKLIKCVAIPLSTIFPDLFR